MESEYKPAYESFRASLSKLDPSLQSELAKIGEDIKRASDQAQFKCQYITSSENEELLAAVKDKLIEDGYRLYNVYDTSPNWFYIVWSEEKLIKVKEKDSTNYVGIMIVLSAILFILVCSILRHLPH